MGRNDPCPCGSGRKSNAAAPPSPSLPPPDGPGHSWPGRPCVPAPLAEVCLPSPLPTPAVSSSPQDVRPLPPAARFCIPNPTAPHWPGTPGTAHGPTPAAAGGRQREAAPTHGVRHRSGTPPALPARRCESQSSRQGEFHPLALQEPDISLSAYPARVIQRCTVAPAASGRTG
ncbi:MAG: SEC-C metal-binding domain-containing protein, partial [Egibacteraceae bacterium]